MADKNDVASWDPIPANNTDISGVPLGEGATYPSHVNNAIRALMAQIATFANGLLGNQIHAAPAKALPVALDEFGFWDSVSGLARKVTKDQLQAAIGLLTADKAKLDSLPAGADLKWISKAIGELYAVDDSMAGADVPPTTNPAFRFIKLTAGGTGAGGYNYGVLTSESVSGSAPLVVATAVIGDAGSPMDGETVNLINTERRVLRAGSAGTLQNDQMQQITGAMSLSAASGAPRADAVSVGAMSRGTSRSNSADIAGGIVGYDIAFDSADSPSARTGNETRSKNIGVTYYMRIK